MPDDSIQPLIPPFASTTSISPASSFPQQTTMEEQRLGAGRRKGKTWVVMVSYAFDWAILILGGILGYIMGHVAPNKRPFSLFDPDISFPFTVSETVPVWMATVISVIAPIIIIAVICLIFVPGATVPRGTPQSLIWKRKLWELHMGWLGLGLSVISTWIITNGMKNLYGKPRPDLLSRCDPDIENVAKYIIGGFSNSSMNGHLVSHLICRNTNSDILDDGFRSYPSGHSSSAAAGLIYLSLFMASKFAITLPFYAPPGSHDSVAFSAFPSRTRLAPANKIEPEAYEMQPRRGPAAVSPGASSIGGNKQIVQQHNTAIAAVRRQAAAPPLYLLLIACLPFFAAVFIASSRWFDFRHHGFDILFGFLIGTISSFFAFRYYHLPISTGAGWAWGPRSPDKAFWAGVGSFSYATDRVHSTYRSGDEEEALETAGEPYGRGTGLSDATPSVRKAPTDERGHVDTAYMSPARGREESRDSRRDSREMDHAR